MLWLSKEIFITKYRIKLRAKNIKLAHQKKSDDSQDNNIISIIQDNKTILIYDMNQKSKPI